MADSAQSPTSSAASEAGDAAAMAARCKKEKQHPEEDEQEDEQDEEQGSSSSPPAAAPSAGRPIKERHSLSLEQRRALRRWASSQAVRPSHRACIDWFRSQYSHTISQSTVSHSLSPKYARLDGDPPQLSGSRLRFGNWPDVERLVLLWHGQAVASSGRHPTNDELAEKARDIFAQLPKYKGEAAPEFSPGWIHRFKKRYGLLMRRQRRHHAAHPDPATDVPYLVGAVPRFLNVGPDTSPAAIRDAVQRVVGVEPTLVTCARVRDDIVRNSGGGTPLAGGHHHHHHQSQPPDLLLQQQEGEHHPPAPRPAIGGGDGFTDEDAEVVLQNALRALQQEEAEAEAAAAAVREARDRAERADRGLPPPGSNSSATTQQQTYAQHALATTTTTTTSAAAASSSSSSSGAPTTPPPPPRQEPGSLSIGGSAPPSSVGAKFASLLGAGNPLTLTPIPADGPATAATTTTTERPIRCPFCVNQRMLRSIKEAVEHMSTHVVV
ncbi:uncharacterized protein E0L32_000539 [Thyridium curvatum]|uniref:HTH CENPB-type domain-containing protein n=1 Tax=Thyridium curvatum TaxID=1093900 RepID=A0A507ATK0_9PEZI|nr:uncharacterized protein E0L32_000539 [Thyridium curvatum]TPX14145.1 hypothetical protein E0L32_000539 [Thyridium curvatum]